MKRKNKQSLYEILSVSLAMLATFLLVFTLFKDERILEKENVLIIYVFFITIIIEIFLLVRTRVNKRNSEVEALNELIEYNQKRKEIEQQIEILTRQLMKSDVAQYIDVNRLVFSGQEQVLNGAIDYDNFLNRFGILREQVKKKPNSAVFLTPFNNDGEQLFRTCQSILSGIDIFLQKTDNRVEKDDILMNIISLIVQSELVIVNINGRNPNVYYELGIAHALGKNTILLSKADFSYEEIGFDIRQKQIIIYKDEIDLERQLLYQISRIKNKE